MNRVHAAPLALVYILEGIFNVSLAQHLYRTRRHLTHLAGTTLGPVFPWYAGHLYATLCLCKLQDQRNTIYSSHVECTRRGCYHCLMTVDSQLKSEFGLRVRPAISFIHFDLRIMPASEDIRKKTSSVLAVCSLHGVLLTERYLMACHVMETSGSVVYRGIWRRWMASLRNDPIGKGESLHSHDTAVQ